MVQEKYRNLLRHITDEELEERGRWPTAPTPTPPPPPPPALPAPVEEFEATEKWPDPTKPKELPQSGTLQGNYPPLRHITDEELAAGTPSPGI